MPLLLLSLTSSLHPLHMWPAAKTMPKTRPHFARYPAQTPFVTTYIGLACPDCNQKPPSSSGQDISLWLFTD